MQIISKVVIKLKYYNIIFLEYSINRNFKNITNKKQNISLENTKVNVKIMYTEQNSKNVIKLVI